MDIQMAGMSELVQRMRAMPKVIQGNAARKAVRAGAQVIRTAMVENTPIQAVKTASSNSLDPGELQADIGTRTTLKNGEAEAWVGPGKKTERVALWVEYGHRAVKGGYSKVLANGKTRGPGKASAVDVPAHPFLRPAFEESAEAAGEAMQAVLLTEIEKAGG